MRIREQRQPPHRHEEPHHHRLTKSLRQLIPSPQPLIMNPNPASRAGSSLVIYSSEDGLSKVKTKNRNKISMVRRRPRQCLLFQKQLLQILRPHRTQQPTPPNRRKTRLQKVPGSQQSLLRQPPLRRHRRGRVATICYSL